MMNIGNLPQTRAGAQRFKGAPAPNMPKQSEPPKDSVNLQSGKDNGDMPNGPHNYGSSRGLWSAALIGGMVVMGAASGAFSPQVQMVHQDARQAVPTCANPLLLYVQEGTPYELDSACLSTTPTVREWGRAHVSLKHEEGTQVRSLWNGTQVEHHYSNDRLTTLDGRVLYEGNPRLNPTFSIAGQETVESYTRIEPAGVAGRYVSALITEGDAQSEAPQRRLMTFHQINANRVQMTDVLDSQSYHKILGAVAAVLQPENEKAFDVLGETINNNFALFQDSGQLKMTVMVPDSTDASKVHEFVFSLPYEVLNQD